MAGTFGCSKTGACQHDDDYETTQTGCQGNGIRGAASSAGKRDRVGEGRGRGSSKQWPGSWEPAPPPPIQMPRLQGQFSQACVSVFVLLSRYFTAPE